MAGSFSVSGLGSTIDFGVLTDAIISARSAPLVQMASKQSMYRSRSEALKQLNSKLLALKASAEGLTDRSVGSGFTATPSNASVLTATAANTAAAGTLSIEVTRLAGSLSQASDSFASEQTAVLAGAATTATFKVYKGGEETATEIVIDSTNNSLAGLRDAINAADAGVRAAIVDVAGDGTGNQLVLSSTDTGAAGRVELVETTATGTDALLNLRTLNPPGGQFSDLDAELKINGLTINRPTNTISDAVTGLTFTLKEAGATTLTVASDSGALKSKIAAFVDAYNAVVDFIGTQYKADASGKPSGVLAQDSTLRAVQRDLRDLAGIASTTNGGAFTELAEIGISRDENGRLAINQTTLNDKLKNSLADVQALFAGATDDASGLATSLTEMSDNLSGSVKTAISGFDASVDRLGKNIANQQARLAALRESLTRQFSIADAAIGQLNDQNTALTSILKSLQPKSDK